MPSLPSSSATAAQNVGPSTVEDPIDSGISDDIKFSTHGWLHRTPVWREVMNWHGISGHIVRCMYINGQISVGRERACSVLVDPPCQRCQRSGREWWIRDLEEETLVKRDKRGECLRLGGNPCLFDVF